MSHHKLVVYNPSQSVFFVGVYMRAHDAQVSLMNQYRLFTIRFIEISLAVSWWYQYWKILKHLHCYKFLLDEFLNKSTYAGVSTGFSAGVPASISVCEVLHQIYALISNTKLHSYPQSQPLFIRNGLLAKHLSHQDGGVVIYCSPHVIVIAFVSTSNKFNKFPILPTS